MLNTDLIPHSNCFEWSIEGTRHQPFYYAFHPSPFFAAVNGWFCMSLFWAED